MGAARKLVSETERVDLKPRVENRHHRRVDAYVCVDMWSGEVLFTGLTMNVSEGGLFVATEVILPVGALVGLHIELPKCATRVLTLGEVRWTRDFTGRGEIPPGLGIRFVGLEPAARAAIREFVQAELVRHPA
jgi:uncharacterized protein (TIGR02266 family)